MLCQKWVSLCSVEKGRGGLGTKLLVRCHYKLLVCGKVSLLHYPRGGHTHAASIYISTMTESGSTEQLPVNLAQEYRVKLGRSFTFPRENAFHAFKYDFKPQSVDSTRPGTLEITEEKAVNVSLPVGQGESGDDYAHFRGPMKKCVKECILIIDRVTGEAILERISDTVQLKATRDSHKPFHRDRSVSPSPFLPQSKAPPPKTSYGKQSANPTKKHSAGLASSLKKSKSAGFGAIKSSESASQPDTVKGNLKPNPSSSHPLLKPDVSKHISRSSSAGQPNRPLSRTGMMAFVDEASLRLLNQTPSVHEVKQPGGVAQPAATQGHSHVQQQSVEDSRLGVSSGGGQTVAIMSSSSSSSGSDSSSGSSSSDSSSDSDEAIDREVAHAFSNPSQPARQASMSILRNDLSLSESGSDSDL